MSEFIATGEPTVMNCRHIGAIFAHRFYYKHKKVGL